jgi:hypothetical protein
VILQLKGTSTSSTDGRTVLSADQRRCMDSK